MGGEQAREAGGGATAVAGRDLKETRWGSQFMKAWWSWSVAMALGAGIERGRGVVNLIVVVVLNRASAC